MLHVSLEHFWNLLSALILPNLFKKKKELWLTGLSLFISSLQNLHCSSPKLQPLRTEPQSSSTSQHLKKHNNQIRIILMLVTKIFCPPLQILQSMVLPSTSLLNFLTFLHCSTEYHCSVQYWNLVEFIIYQK